MTDYMRDIVPGRGTILFPGDNLFSATKAFRLAFQKGDGNLVLAVINDATLPRDSIEGTYDKAIWQAGISLATAVVGTANAVMQENGDFVVSASFIPEGPQLVWHTNTPNNNGAFLRCQDDGNLVIYTTTGVAIWATNTYAGPR